MTKNPPVSYREDLSPLPRPPGTVTRTIIKSEEKRILHAVALGRLLLGGHKQIVVRPDPENTP